MLLYFVNVQFQFLRQTFHKKESMLMCGMCLLSIHNLKARLNGFNILPNTCSFKKSWTDVGKMLDERSVQTACTPFNIFKNQENDKSMLNKFECLKQLKFDSTHFQHAFNTFYAFYNVGKPVV